MTKSSFEKGEVGSRALPFDDPVGNRRLDVRTVLTKYELRKHSEKRNYRQQGATELSEIRFKNVMMY